MIRSLLMLFGILGTVSFAGMPSAQAAFDPYGGVKCSGKNTSSTVCTEKGKGDKDPLSGSDGVIVKIANLIALFAGAAAVILILIGSIKYITSNGDPKGLGEAKSTIFNAIIGLIVIVLARSIITFVVSRI